MKKLWWFGDCKTQKAMEFEGITEKAKEKDVLAAFFQGTEEGFLKDENQVVEIKVLEIEKQVGKKGSED